MKYLIINTIIALCAVLHADGQAIINPSFTQLGANRDLTGWKLVGQHFANDSNNAHTKPACVYTYNMNYGKATCIQDIPFSPGKIRHYKLKTFIRTETRSGYASVWVKTTDRRNNLIHYDTLNADKIRGTTAWREYELAFSTTADVANLEVGLFLSGKGKAWFDDVSIEALPDADLPKSKSNIAEQYLGEVRDVLKNQCWYADSVNLDDVYKNALLEVTGATSAGDCYPGVAYMLDRLGDRNGRFYDPATTRNWYKEQKINDNEALYPSAAMDSGLVMIWLPGVTSLTESTLQRYADTLHKQLAAFDQNKIKGWIVDLRENVGGNATAMLAAIGPLLDKKVCGKYIRRNGTVDWTYDNGQAKIDTTIIKIDKPFKVKKQGLPLAVLTSQETYGAGELALLALKSRNNVRSFGEPTVGITVNEKRVTLSDGAMLFFTAGIMSDTKGKRYHGKIWADVPVQMIYKEDHCLGKALKWLNEQKTD